MRRAAALLALAASDDLGSAVQLIDEIPPTEWRGVLICVLVLIESETPLTMRFDAVERLRSHVAQSDERLAALDVVRAEIARSR